MYFPPACLTHIRWKTIKASGVVSKSERRLYATAGNLHTSNLMRRRVTEISGDAYPLSDEGAKDDR